MSTSANASLTVGTVTVELIVYCQPGGDLVVAINRGGSAIARIRFEEAVAADLDLVEALRRRRDLSVCCATGEVAS